MLPDFNDKPETGLVSIIIPTYNAERFLAETLESAFGQTYPHTEIIVIDDGSIDNTARLIHSYQKRLTAEFTPNRGVSAARNQGTALARGEFIQYLDADDLLTPDAIAQRVEVLHKTKADVAYSDWERIAENAAGVFSIAERIVRRIEDIHPSVEIALLTNFWAPPAALTYRHTIVKKINGWKEWLPIIQDARFLQDACLLGGQFAYAPGVGAQYRVHGSGSLSRRSESAFVADVFRNACDLQVTFERRGKITGQERQALSQIYSYVARALFKEDKSGFESCVVKLYSVDPGFRLTWPKIASLTSKMFGFRVARALIPMLTKMREIAR